MRARDATDDRQRAVHHLVREGVCSEDGALDHLTEDELAGLVSGTLFRTECGRAESHLMSCRACRHLAHELHRDHEAGVQPILLRRALAPDPKPTRLGARLTRRYSPWVLGILAFVVLAAVPVSLGLLSTGELVATERYLVLTRVGTPVMKREGARHHRPAETGAWIHRGSVLLLESGDVLDVINSAGRLVRITESGIEGDSAENRTLAGVFEDAWGRRSAVDAMRRVPVERIDRAGHPLSILHPRGTIYALRPTARWSDEEAHDTFDARLDELLDQGATEVFDVRADGRSLRFPRGALTLAPGRRYRMSIRADVPGKVAEPVVFETLGGDRRVVVAADLDAVRALVGQGPSIVRAALYLRHDLPSEAKEELERLRGRDHGNVHILSLLKFVYRQLGLEGEVARCHRLLEKHGD